MHFAKVKGILSQKNMMNLYRGCTHGCIYCDSRSLCYGMKHDFEDIEIKENSLELLEDTLMRRRSKCMIGMGSMTDPYLPEEADLRYTRRALEIIHKYGFGVNFITKSNMVLRDLDIIKKIHEKTKCVVQITMTTYDENLCKMLEPKVSTTRERFETLKVLNEAGIPTVVWFIPILPFINDTEENVKGILSYCRDAGVYGVMNFGMGMTLRDGNREYYYAKLDHHFPGLKEKYIRTYGDSYVLNSPNNKHLMELFHTLCEEYNLVHNNSELFRFTNTFYEDNSVSQISMFDF